MRALALVLAFVSTPAMTADQQFDLVCSAKKVTERYRVDLIRGEWCFGKCENVLKLARVTSGEVTFVEHEKQYPSDYTAYNRVNRVSGEWEWYNHNPRYATIQDIKGKCERAPFTGFPAAKF